MLKKGGLAAITSLLVISGALGGATGYFLGTMFKPVKEIDNKVYFDEVVTYSKNQEGVKKLFSAAKVNEISELKNVDVSTLVGVGGLTVGDIAEASQNIFYESKFIKAYSNNLAFSTSMNIENLQETNSTWVKKDNIYFKENISYSRNAEFGERTYNIDPKQITVLSKPLDNQLRYFRTNKLPEKNASRCNYDNASNETYFVNTPEDQLDDNGKLIKSYSTFFGTSLYKAFNYDFNENNLLKEADKKTYAKATIKNTKTEQQTEYETKIVSTNEGYEISMVFDIKAMENYASYIFTTTRDASKITKMAKKPEFIKVGAKLTTDKELRPISLHTDESYNVISSLVGEVLTYCTSDLIFTYGNENETIPTIKEEIKYGK